MSWGFFTPLIGSAFKVRSAIFIASRSLRTHVRLTPTNSSVLPHENFIAACEQFGLLQCKERREGTRILNREIRGIREGGRNFGCCERCPTQNPYGNDRFGDIALKRRKKKGPECDRKMRLGVFPFATLRLCDFATLR